MNVNKSVCKRITTEGGATLKLVQDSEVDTAVEWWMPNRPHRPHFSLANRLDLSLVNISAPILHL